MKGKKRTVQAGICVVSLVLIWFFFLFATEWINRQIVPCEDDFSWVFQVDKAEAMEGELTLDGFAFQLGKDAGKRDFEVVLQELDSQKFFFPKTTYAEREDVNNYFLCEYSYLNSGFNAQISEKKLDLQQKDYEILIRIAGKKKAYRTGTYLSKGELMYVNPKDYVPLEVEGTDLEKIVKEGVLRVYRPDYGMYVYQYEGELYWIAEPDYGFVDGDTLVQYQLDTTQISKLPKHRLENQWYWDNIGFWFNDNEITKCNVGKYRVTRKALPKEYSISKIWTGNYINQWIWEQDFRPYYELMK